MSAVMPASARSPPPSADPRCGWLSSPSANTTSASWLGRRLRPWATGGWGLLALTVRGSALSLAAFLAGVPLGPLAQVAAYGRDVRDRRSGKSHAPEPYCRYARGPLSDRDDRVLLCDLLPIIAAENAQAQRGGASSRFCSKCGGYAIRRLTSEQQHYYLSVAGLADDMRAVVDGEQLLADRDLRSGPWAAASITYVIGRLDQILSRMSAVAELPQTPGFAQELAERADVARRRLAMLRH